MLQTALPPAGAKVLLVLGELDCREGLLMAVEKLKVCVSSQQTVCVCSALGLYV